MIGSASLSLPANVGEITNVTHTIRFNGSSSIADGQTFTIGDGISTVTFEFDDLALPVGSPNIGVAAGNVAVPFNRAIVESANVIASRIRDIIIRLQSKLGCERVPSRSTVVSLALARRPSI